MGRLEEIKERDKNATKGPWHHGDGDCILQDTDNQDILWYDWDETGGSMNVDGNTEDFEFIAHAREDIPWLIEQNRIMEDTMKFLIEELDKIKNAKAK